MFKFLFMSIFLFTSSYAYSNGAVVYHMQQQEAEKNKKIKENNILLEENKIVKNKLLPNSGFLPISYDFFFFKNENLLICPDGTFKREQHCISKKLLKKGIFTNSYEYTIEIYGVSVQEYLDVKFGKDKVKFIGVAPTINNSINIYYL